MEPETRSNDQPDLLRAKLHRPRVTHDLVVRPRLLELLDRGLDSRLTLVSAPAGFGKTTLISSWLEGMAAARDGDPANPPAAWLSLDRQDGDLGLFLRYVVAALRSLFPGAASETLALLRSPQQVPAAHLFNALSNEIDALPGRFVLVLDDYHLLAGQAVHEFLNLLVEHWPRPLHLVLISRVDPPLPLSSLRAKGKMTEIHTADLRFNAEETAAYLDQVLESPLRDQDRELLEQHTGGWIAALQLAGLSLHSPRRLASIPSSVARTPRSLSDYMQDEVFAQQVPAIQTFLLKTSIMDRFCAPLCEAVVGQVDPAWSVRACLDWIERADLFIFPLDDAREWYRYHALFGEFLRRRLLARFGAEVVRGLHQKAAAWFAQEGLVHEAVQHALRAGDLDLANKVVKDRLRDLLNREDRSTLDHWLSALPEEVVERRPWLLMAKAWTLQISFQLARQLTVLSQVEALIEEDGDANLSAEEMQMLRALALPLWAQEAYLGNQPARSLAMCEEALALLPRDWAFPRGAAMTYWGVSMGAIGQRQAADRRLLEEYNSLDDKASLYALHTLLPLCSNYLDAGQLEAASRTAQVMLQQAIRAANTNVQGWARMFLGLASYQWNDLDAAGVYLAEIVDLRYRIRSFPAHNSITQLALVHQARGESAEAWRLVELLSQFQLEQGGQELDELRSLRAGLMLDQGDREGAFRWADAFTAPVPERMLLWTEVPHITRARILLARNRVGDVRLALQILEDVLDLAERTHSTRWRIAILALRALALDAQGNTWQALVALQEAVELAQPGGWLRVFVDLGPQMEGLLGRLAEQSSAAEPIRRILAAFPGSGRGMMAGATQPPPERRGQAAPGVPAPESRALVEPLTARELEILTLLREPLWPKEIARQLDISYSTVKRHTVNIYGKLGVNTRWEAVNRAVELGILPPR